MSDAVLQAEARLKDYISGSLKDIESNLKKFNDQIKDTKVKSDSANVSFSGLKDATNKLGSAFVAAAPVALIAGFIALINKSSELGSTFYDMSKRIGLGTEFLSGLDFVAKQAGTSIQSLEPSLRKATISLYSAASGGTEAKTAFSSLGMSVTSATLATKSQTELLQETMIRLSGVKNKTEQIALAQQIFGRSGTQLLPILDQGNEAIKEQMERAKELGLVWTEDSAAGADAFGDAMFELKSVLTGFLNTVTVPMMKGMAGILIALTDTYISLKTYLTPTFEAFGTVLKYTVIPVINFAVNTVGSLGVMFESVVGGIAEQAALLLNVFSNIKNFEFKKALTGILDLPATIGRSVLEGMDKVKTVFSTTDYTKIFQGIENASKKSGKIISDNLNPLGTNKPNVINMDTFNKKNKELAERLLQEEENEDKKDQKNLDRIKEFNIKEKELKDKKLQEDKERREKELNDHRALQEAKLSATATFLNGVSSITQVFEGKNKALRLLSKTAAIGEIGVHTAVAAMKAYRDVPLPFSILASAGIVAAGAANIAKVSGIKFERGGPVYGPSHSMGGVNAELEGGEYVLSKNNVNKLGGLSNINTLVSGGARSVIDARSTITINLSNVDKSDIPYIRSGIEETYDNYLKKLKRGLSDLNRKGLVTV